MATMTKPESDVKTEANRQENRRRAEHAVSTELSVISNREFAEIRLSPKSVEAHLGHVLSAEKAEILPQGKLNAYRSAHLVQLCSTPLLKADEERELFRMMNYCKHRANASRSVLNPRRPNLRKLDEFEEFYILSDRLRNHIVNANVRLVVSIVKKFADLKNNFDELFSEGVLALMRAADKFDYARGYRFSTYATCAIRRELANYVEKQARRRQRFHSGVGDLLQTSLEPPMPASLPPQTHSDLYLKLKKLLSSLDGREKKILMARYGFHSDERKRTFQNLGEELGVCKERVRQLEARALQKLRKLAKDVEFHPELSRV